MIMKKLLLVLILIALCFPIVTATIPPAGTYYQGQTVAFSGITLTEANSTCQGLGFDRAALSNLEWGAYSFDGDITMPGGINTAGIMSWVGISGTSPFSDKTVSVTGYTNLSINCQRAAPKPYYWNGFTWPADPVTTCNLVNNNCAIGGSIPVYRYYFINTPADEIANTTFSISETGNFTKKLSGALVTLSNGQYNTTVTDGTAFIGITPNSSTYTYSISKSGYWTNFGALGGVGQIGGTLYLTLDPSGIYTVPTGYTRTVVFVTDGGTGGTLVGATLNLRDVQNNTWKNTTSVAAGTTFDVITGHTIDIYGSYPGVYTSSYELGAVAGGNYYLPLMPPYPTPAGGLSGGLINLFVNVRDGNGNASLAHATVTVKLPTGATTVRDSGDWGSAMFVVPNNTVIILSGSKTGYNTISQSFTSEQDLEQMVDLRMYKVWALATTTSIPGAVVTDPATGLPLIDPLTGLPVTVQPTLDIRTDAQKDQDLMNLLRDNGETIMNLAILAIIFGLIKMVMKF
jgi:hypothetical protein